MGRLFMGVLKGKGGSGRHPTTPGTSGEVVVSKVRVCMRGGGAAGVRASEW